MNRGEVWWVERPNTGRRPFLVLTRQEALPVLRAVIGVPATRTIRDIPTEVRLGPADGMPDECALSLDNVTVLRRAYFVQRICRLGPERMREVCTALSLSTGCG